MTTRILSIDEKSLSIAEKIITNGGAVAFPTETVYGLGADARSQTAVENIFLIKGRPSDNPLIVHVHKDYDIGKIAAEIPDYAAKLAEKFLPGPLTMVYKSRGAVCGAVSAGLDTVAVRIPSHEGAQRFLKFLDIPIAAPSANISKHVSATSAEHVLADFDGKIELILDGGKCSGGIESTVIDCTGEYPVVLRSGLISREMIEACVGRCGEYAYKEGQAARSPGMKYKHYSPYCRTLSFPAEETQKALAAYDRALNEGQRVCILCEDGVMPLVGGRQAIGIGHTPEEMASKLYASLREAEKKYDLLVAVIPAERGGVMTGVLNRLTKACKSHE